MFQEKKRKNRDDEPALFESILLTRFSAVQGDFFFCAFYSRSRETPLLKAFRQNHSKVMKFELEFVTISTLIIGDQRSKQPGAGIFAPFFFHFHSTWSLGNLLHLFMIIACCPKKIFAIWPPNFCIIMLRRQNL